MIYPNPIPWHRPGPSARPHNGPIGVRTRPSAGLTVLPAPPAQPWSRRKRIKTVLAAVALGALTLATIGILGLILLMARLKPTIPSIAQIATFQPIAATEVYSSDGVLLARLQIENRQPVTLKQVSPNLVAATVAVEDSRFYEHPGVDFRGVVRAVVSNVTSGDATGQGASTITQQLARNVSQFGLSREKRLARKVREAMTAVRIEQVFTKDEILELYLNQIYYGSGAYGIEAAARTYFGKRAARLSLSEAALLAGLPQRPLFYSPYANPKAAHDRRDVVLKRMLDTRRISIADYERAKSEPIKLAGRHKNHTIYRAPYFVDWVVQDLVARHGVDAVYSGWKIVTTLDWRMQEQAEKSLRRGLRSGATQGALVCLDPHSGDVRAMVGGMDYQKDRFNAVTQGKRQPGSAFKPFVYAAAFESGSLSLASMIEDKPLEIPTDEVRHKVWKVRNYGGDYKNKEVSVLDAIANSTNTVAVQAAQEIGVSRVIDCAHRLGITTDLAPYLPLALGASAVRPLELCAAYGVFAADGNLYRPTGIQNITDNIGRIVEKHEFLKGMTPGAVSGNTVEQMNTALHAVVQQGTGTAASGVPNAFGKTGTTSDHRDAWFVGYTPELVTAVWVAHPEKDSKGRLRYLPMPGATGGHVAAPLWANFMRVAAPIQQKVNRLRHVQAWAIALPPPPPKVTELCLDEEKTDSEVTGGEIAVEASSSPDGNPDAAPIVHTVQADPSLMNDREDFRIQRQTSFDPEEATGIRQANFADHGAPARRPRPGGKTVRVCGETGLLATEWCDTTYLLDTANGVAPTRACTRHHAPFGE